MLAWCSFCSRCGVDCQIGCGSGGPRRSNFVLDDNKVIGIGAAISVNSGLGRKHSGSFPVYLVVVVLSEGTSGHFALGLWRKLSPPVPISYRHCSQCQGVSVAFRNNASASATDLATPAMPPAVSTAASHCRCSGVRRPVRGVLTSMLVNTATC